MKEDDILAQLHDIHLPPDLAAAATAQFAAWPFVALAACLLGILALRLWIRNQWRRSARADLARILAIPDRPTQWAGLLTFAANLSSRSGQSLSLPATAFVRPESVTDEQRAAFIAFLSAQMRR